MTRHIRAHFRAAAMLCLLAFASSAAHGGNLCTYTTYKWNMHDRKAVGLHKVVKPYSEVTAAETDPQTGCTVCEEDQVMLSFPGIRPFTVCKRLAPQIRKIIAGLLDRHASVRDVVGYRVGLTRGKPDKDGNRNGFSNHSFGVALDVNTMPNGLYDHCLTVSPACRLIKGGRWDPEQALSLTADSVIVRTFKSNGFKWGGEIAGWQKDFMHFSPTGY
jgi:hypothetical protein